MMLEDQPQGNMIFAPIRNFINKNVLKRNQVDLEESSEDQELQKGLNNITIAMDSLKENIT